MAGNSDSGSGANARFQKYLNAPVSEVNKGIRKHSDQSVSTAIVAREYAPNEYLKVSYNLYKCDGEHANVFAKFYGEVCAADRLCFETAAAYLLDCKIDEKPIRANLKGTEVEVVNDVPQTIEGKELVELSKGDMEYARIGLCLYVISWPARGADSRSKQHKIFTTNLTNILSSRTVSVSPGFVEGLQRLTGLNSQVVKTASAIVTHMLMHSTSPVLPQLTLYTFVRPVGGNSVVLMKRYDELQKVTPDLFLDDGLSGHYVIRSGLAAVRSMWDYVDMLTSKGHSGQLIFIARLVDNGFFMFLSETKVKAFAAYMAISRAVWENQYNEVRNIMHRSITGKLVGQHALSHLISLVEEKRNAISRDAWNLTGVTASAKAIAKAKAIMNAELEEDEEEETIPGAE